MNDILYASLQDVLKRVKAVGGFTIWDEDDRPLCEGLRAGESTSKRKRGQAEYSLQFSTLWQAIPSWIRAGKSKPKTFEAFRKAVKDGHAPEAIITAVPYYVKEQTLRRKADPDCQLLHPDRWIKEERFDGYQSGDPNVPKRSEFDITCDLIGKKLGINLSGVEKPTLSECLSEGLTRDEIIARLEEGVSEGESLQHFLYRITDELNKGEE